VTLQPVTCRLEWVRANLQHFLVIALFWAFAYTRWQTMTFQNEAIIQQLHYNPHIYRLWTQLLIFLDGAPCSFATLVSVAFALTATLLYLVCPTKDRLILASFLLFVAASGSMRQAPVYLILAIAIMYQDHFLTPALAVPLTIIKEHAAIVLIIALLTCREYKQALLTLVFFGSTFLLIRVVVGPSEFFSPPTAPEYAVQTPIISLAPYILRLQTWHNWALLAAALGLTTLLVQDRREVGLFALNLPVILVFGLVFESQLWLMPAIAVIFGRTINNAGKKNIFFSPKEDITNA